MKSDVRTSSRLEFLQYRGGCACLSDLNPFRLAGVPEQSPAEAASVQSWNDALDDLAEASSEQTVEDARERLIAMWKHGRFPPLGHGFQGKNIKNAENIQEEKVI